MWSLLTSNHWACDSNVSVKGYHSSYMNQVEKFRRRIFPFHPGQLNLAGRDGMARLVIIYTLTKQLQGESNRVKEHSLKNSLHNNTLAFVG